MLFPEPNVDIVPRLDLPYGLFEVYLPKILREFYYFRVVRTSVGHPAVVV